MHQGLMKYEYWCKNDMYFLCLWRADVLQPFELQWCHYVPTFSRVYVGFSKRILKCDGRGVFSFYFYDGTKKEKTILSPSGEKRKNSARIFLLVHVTMNTTCCFFYDFRRLKYCMRGFRSSQRLNRWAYLHFIALATQ